MGDYSRPETISLKELKDRILSTDLIPSRVSLLEDLDLVFTKLEQHGLKTWQDLQKSVKNPKQLEAFAKLTGIECDYLVLLRREVEGYLPKPFALKEFHWVPNGVIDTLANNGITTTTAVLNLDDTWINTFAVDNKFDLTVLQQIKKIADLCRVQWVSPVTARLLIETGCDSCEKLAVANGEDLCNAVDRVNKENGYFNGKIGLRDINRLINAANYSSSSLLGRS